MVIRGKMVGVPMFGGCTDIEMQNIQRLANAITELKSAIEVVFDAEVANAKMRVLGESSLEIADGDLPSNIEDALRTMFENGYIRSSNSQRRNVRRIEERLMIH